MKILYDETISNHVYNNYISLSVNSIWFYDFTTLSMLHNIPHTDVLIISEIASRKVIGFELFESKKNVTSQTLIQVFDKTIKQFGAPGTIYSDYKNVTSELTDWFSSQGITVSINKDDEGNIVPIHGNQAIE